VSPLVVVVSGDVRSGSCEEAGERLRFTSLVEEFVALVEERAAAKSGPVDPPLLLLLDECANIAPLPHLDELASIAPGLGIQLMSVFQDLAQAEARFGPRWKSMVKNHRVTLVGRTISDLLTSDYFRN
jgi:type IV secretion system protein VirD4